MLSPLCEGRRSSHHSRGAETSIIEHPSSFELFMTALAKIGITMGDPSGIGPEIIVKALREMSPEQRSASAVVGDLDFLRRADRMVSAGLTYADSPESARNGVV